jgi:hypothetical protein
MTIANRPGRALPILEPLVTARPVMDVPSVSDRLAEYRPEPRSLPRFVVWTLGCQMNRSDS